MMARARDAEEAAARRYEGGRGASMIDIAIVLLVIAGFIALRFYASACRALIRSLNSEGRI
jgi:hypothetical protein